MQAVRFKLWPFYGQENSHKYRLDRRLVGSRAVLNPVEERKVCEGQYLVGYYAI
jgi:hypothetical protein